MTVFLFTHGLTTINKMFKRSSRIISTVETVDWGRKSCKDCIGSSTSTREDGITVTGKNDSVIRVTKN